MVVWQDGLDWDHEDADFHVFSKMLGDEGNEVCKLLGVGLGFGLAWGFWGWVHYERKSFINY